MAAELRLVPITATAAMLEAGQRAWLSDTPRKSSTLYAAMVAAAPAAKLGPAFAVSRVGTATKYGGTTYTLKAHFHTRDHAEVARVLLEERALPPGPFPAQIAEQAELIDVAKLEKALIRCGCSCPSGEMLSWWVGREVNRLIDCVLNGDGVVAPGPAATERRVAELLVALKKARNAMAGSAELHAEIDAVIAANGGVGACNQGKANDDAAQQDEKA